MSYGSMEKSLIYIISEQGGMSTCLYQMLLWHVWGLFQWCIFSLGFILLLNMGFCGPFWTGKEALIIVFLTLFLVMVTLASLSGCIIYLTDQQEDGDISLLYPMLLWYRRLSQCYKLKHGFYYIYALYGLFGTGKRH